MSLTPDISDTDIQYFQDIKEHRPDTLPVFFPLCSCYLKLLISQSKIFGTRKFTVKYQ